MSDYLVKLVRDAAGGEGGEGGAVVFVALDEATYHRELRRKLAEEVYEYQEARSASELADVLAVVEALAHSQHDLTLAELWDLEEAKRVERGGFDCATGMFVRREAP